MKLLALLQSLLILNIFIVQSGSMEPVVHTGSIVFTIKKPTYTAGEIVSFRPDLSKETTVTHRIVSDIDNEYITSGDANSTIDSTRITDKNIIGKVFLTIPYLGYLFNWAKTPKGLIVFVLIPATIIIYEELKFIFSEINKRFKIDNKFKKSYLLIPIFPLVGSLILFTNYSGAFFNDNKISTRNVLSVSSSLPTSSTSLIYNSNSFNCSLGATDFSSRQLEKVTLTKTTDKIKVFVDLVGATPNSSYDIWINQDPNGCPLSSPTKISAIITDGNGNGSGEAEKDLIIGAKNYWISAVGGGQVLRSVSVSL